jgi:hypothetical protein
MPSTANDNCGNDTDVTNIDEDGPPTHRRASEEILNAIITVATTAIQHGIILDHWHDIINVMIEKIPGQPLVHKLRVIHLIEADFNLLVGIQWGRHVMAQAETLHALDDQQYGSWKGRSAEDTALLKHITYDLMCITRSDGATFDNDARACYDRIIPNLMSLCGQQLGLPRHITQAHATLLLNALYSLKTTLGVTDTFLLEFTRATTLWTWPRQSCRPIHLGHHLLASPLHHEQEALGHLLLRPPTNSNSYTHHGRLRR